MATTMISPAGELAALDHYVGNAPSKDRDSPMPTERAESVSCIGDCTPETFVADVRRVREQHGKQTLALEAYHVIISQTHEEADAHDVSAGWRQHEMVRAFVEEAFPGHQAKLVTQRDNGRWVVDANGVKSWEPGKWHTHVIVANVAEREATLSRLDADGLVVTRDYKAGRAIDGYMNSIRELRATADRVILRELGYDNAKYVDDCRRAGRGERVTSKDYAQRAAQGYSSHDEVRVRLRDARSQATSWDDYTVRLEADAVWTRVTGKAGVSYAWVDRHGEEHKARARGKEGLGSDFTKAEVEKQCEINAERVGRGEALERPEPELVPAPVEPAERPVPVYLTPDGRPPWEREVDEYAERVQGSGGTYEAQARERIDLALVDDWVTDRDHLVAAAPDHGIDVTGREGEPLIALDTSDGRVMFASGHLGEEYGGDQLDRRIESRRKEHGHGRGSGDAAGRDAGGRSADEGIRVEQIDGAGVAALRAENLRRRAHDSTERDDRRGERPGPGGEARREQLDRGEARRTEQPDRGTGRPARSDTPLRDRAVQREQERPRAADDRERD